jgi:hypothetical protein
MNYSNPRTPYELGKARKFARKVQETTLCANCCKDVPIEDGATCQGCGTPVNSKLVSVCAIIESNATMAIDQHHEYATLEEAFDVYYDNVADTIDEQGLMTYYNEGFHRNSLPMFRAYFALEADRQGVKVPDKLLGIEYQKKDLW